MVLRHYLSTDLARQSPPQSRLLLFEDPSPTESRLDDALSAAEGVDGAAMEREGEASWRTRFFCVFFGLGGFCALAIAFSFLRPAGVFSG